MKTKDKIVQQALFQFNQEGVERVTTSSIAKMLGISVGNLHYHFPNRDRIIIQLVDDFFEAEQVLSEKLIATPIHNFISHAFMSQMLAFKIIWDYRFIFVDRKVIQRRTTYLESRFNEMLKRRKQEFHQTLQVLQANGIIREEISRQTLDAYFTQIVIGNNSWISYTDLFDYDVEPYIYFSTCAIWAWKPYLNCTDEEMEQAIQFALEYKEQYFNM